MPRFVRLMFVISVQNKPVFVDPVDVSALADVEFVEILFPDPVYGYVKANYAVKAVFPVVYRL